MPDVTSTATIREAGAQAAIRYAIGLLRLRAPKLPEPHRQVEALHLEALQRLLGLTTGNTRRVGERTPRIALPPPVDQPNSIAAHDDVPTAFQVCTTEDHERARRMLERFEGRPSSPRASQTLALMRHRVQAFDQEGKS